jgi:RimJ/RimL family protein N-acetyltransferase
VSEYRIEPWSPGDLSLLERLLGDPAMMEHLGGAQSSEKIGRRQERYLALQGEGPEKMFKIVEASTGEGVGSVGFWEREWGGTQVYETGWMVLPEFQGRGIATTATARVIELVRAEGKHRFLHAFPSVENAASNAICRKLGFELLDEHDFEYPKDSGNVLHCNNWRLDLFE